MRESITTTTNNAQTECRTRMVWNGVVMEDAVWYGENGMEWNLNRMERECSAPARNPPPNGMQ